MLIDTAWCCLDPHCEEGTFWFSAVQFIYPKLRLRDPVSAYISVNFERIDFFNISISESQNPVFDTVILRLISTFFGFNLSENG